MDLTIHQSCPSCGAKIELSEADRLIRCPYCEVNNFMVSRGILRFVLPDKVPEHIDRTSIFYAPYLRFKGNVFYCKGKFLKYKVVDTTSRALNGSVLPSSLGLRPQALTLSPVSREMEGCFLRQGIKASVLLDRAAQLTVIDSEKIKADFYHRAYIGENISCIYLPLYIDNGALYDGVTNRELAHGGSPEKMRGLGVSFRQEWTPHFLATLCPRCGDALSGEHDSLILSCYNCHSSWEEKQGEFHPISWNAVASDHDDMYYLPFWKIRMRSRGVEMNSFADLLRLTNQPLVVQPQHEEMDLIFWVPAFKLRPSTFLRLGRNMTLSQARIPEGEEQMRNKMHPVTLPRGEAIQALKSVVADAALNKKTLLPRLPHMRLQPRDSSLCYLPFFDQGHDLVQEQTSLALAKSVLHFGRML